MRLIALSFLVCTLGAANGTPVAQKTGTQTYLDVIKCAGQLDFACVLDKSEEIVIERQRRLLVEADKEVALRGRQNSDDVDETPSSLIESIGSLFSEITQIIYKNGIAGFFRDGKDDSSELVDDDDDDDDEDEVGETLTPENVKKGATLSVHQKKDDAKSRSNKAVSEARGKKKKQKKQKIKAIIKLLILGIVMYFKLTILLKVVAAHLQFKFLLVAAAGLLLNAARFYLELKKGHNPQKVIYYEHAQHQHHYENDDDSSWGGLGGGGGGAVGGGSGGGHGSYWGRSYDDQGPERDAQHLAYRGQPAVQAQQESSNSWF